MLTVDDTSAQILVLRVVDVSFLRFNGRDFWLGGFLLLCRNFGLGGGDLRLHKLFLRRWLLWLLLRRYLGVRLANLGLGGGDLRLHMLFDVRLVKGLSLRTHVLDGGDALVAFGSWLFVCIH